MDDVNCRAGLGGHSPDNKYISKGTAIVPPVAQHLVNMALSLIDENPAHHWTAQDLAEQCGLSRCHFSRVFNRAVGSSVPSYMATKRVETAKRLLITTRVPIKEIAVQCGYCNISHFTRDFKRFAMATPASYRLTQALYRGYS
jgi:transcriptional regulator GlxA family with amidase domain